MVFNVFGSRDLPRDPQETQEPPKKHPKSSKGLKKIHHEKSKNDAVVKNALRWRSHFKLRMEPIFGPTFCSFLSSSFT